MMVFYKFLANDTIAIDGDKYVPSEKYIFADILKLLVSLPAISKRFPETLFEFMPDSQVFRTLRTNKVYI